MAVKEIAKQLLDFLSRPDVEWVNVGDNPKFKITDRTPHCLLTGLNNLPSCTIPVEDKNQFKIAVLDKIGAEVPSHLARCNKIIENWNDAPGRTFEDVKELLTSIAEGK
jgi:hypothetical protein